MSAIGAAGKRFFRPPDLTLSDSLTEEIVVRRSLFCGVTNEAGAIRFTPPAARLPSAGSALPGFCPLFAAARTRRPRATTPSSDKRRAAGLIAECCSETESLLRRFGWLMANALQFEHAGLRSRAARGGETADFAAGG